MITTRSNFLRATNRRRVLVSYGRTMSTIDDYQYLQKSKLPTMYFQRSLPRLPIPLLERTCDRFLAAVKPIVSEEEHAKTQQTVTEFRHGVGMQLHTLLKQNDESNKHTSYISKPWFDMYLSDRAPLPLNYNPLLVMKNDSRAEYQSQVVRATNMIISSMRFWRSLREGVLEPEVFHLNPKKSDTPEFRKWMKLAPTVVATYAAYVFKAFPLDMSQYQRLFGVSRIPYIGMDRLVERPESKHILVMRRGNLYAIDVLDKNGKIYSPNVIHARLQAVVKKDSESTAAEFPLGVLTSTERDTWAKTRAHLVEISDENRKTLEDEVDAALFCLCLDSEQDPVYDDDCPVPILKNLLAGVGKNRWFDKSVSLLIANDGTAAVNFEHSWGDGVAVLRYLNEIYKESSERPFVSAKEVSSLDPSEIANVRSLNFQLDDRIRQDVTKAIGQSTAVMESLNMDMLRYPHLSKTSCKQFKLSPDSVMQLSFQLAYRQAFGGYVGTYESCSTAAFRHGRTETMRPCTSLTKSFCEAILQPSKAKPGTKELRALIDQCSTRHQQLTKEAAMGQGFDRHLFALKHVATQANMPIHSLYESEAYRKINYNIISTSTLSSNAILAGSFGPVVRDGLGVGYSIQDSECGAIVTSYKNQANGKEFVESLEQAFGEIRNVIS